MRIKFLGLLLVLSLPALSDGTIIERLKAYGDQVGAPLDRYAKEGDQKQQQRPAEKESVEEAPEVITPAPPQPIESWDASMLLQAVAGMQPGEWREIPDTRIPLVSAAELKAIHERAGGQPLYGNVGPRSVIIAWNSAAYDRKRGHWYFFGGGHADYGGNEVYRFDLTALSWERLTSPAPLNGRDEAEGGTETCLAPESSPLSPHTYDGLIWNPVRDELWLFPHRGFCLLGRAELQQRWWSFNPETRGWTDHPTPGLAPGYAGTAWIYDTERLFLIPAESYDPSGYTAGPVVMDSSGAVIDRGQSRAPGASSNTEYNPARREIISLFHSGVYARGLEAEDTMDRLTAWTRDIASLTDGAGAASAGFEYHPPSGRFLLWFGSREMALFDREKKQFSVLNNTASATAPKAVNPHVYNKFRWIPTAGVFVGYANPDQGLWVYRPPENLGEDAAFSAEQDVARPGVATAASATVSAKVMAGQNVLSCADVSGPCEEMHPGDDYKQKALSLPSTGGTLVVFPGDYLITKSPWLSKRKSLDLIGILDEDGKKPRFWAQPKTVNAFVGWGATNGDLTVRNMHFDGGGDCVFAGSNKHKQVVILDNVKLENCGHGLMGAFEYDKTAPETSTIDDRYFLVNVECSMSGTHCIYIDRARYAKIEGGKYYHPGYHAIKIVAQEIEISNVIASNVGLDGSLRKDGKIGGAIMSLLSCQWGEVHDNDIHFMMTPSTGGNVITRQPRHDIKGCDIPPYSGAEFWTSEYWQDPDEFEMRVSNNSVRLSRDARMSAAITLVRTISTAPLEAVESGSSRLRWIKRPGRWQERTRTVVADNTIEGMRASDRLCVSSFWGNMVDGDVAPPPQVEMCVSE